MYLIINHSSMQPIYEQIVEQIKEKIINGEFSEEDDASVCPYNGERFKNQCAHCKKSL